MRDGEGCGKADGGGCCRCTGAGAEVAADCARPNCARKSAFERIGMCARRWLLANAEHTREHERRVVATCNKFVCRPKAPSHPRPPPVTPDAVHSLSNRSISKQLFSK